MTLHKLLKTLSKKLDKEIQLLKEKIKVIFFLSKIFSYQNKAEDFLHLNSCFDVNSKSVFSNLM